MSQEGGGGSLLSTVWMIHAYTGARTGVRGRLSFEPDRLRFEPDAGQRGGQVELPLSDIGSVQVPVGSPVLELELFALAAANAIIRDEVLAWESAIRLAQAPGPA